MRPCINECKVNNKSETVEYRDATRGLVCENCYTELRDSLLLAPDIVHHLHSIYGGLSGHSSDGSQKIKREPPAPLNLSAFELCENIYRTLVGNAISIQATSTSVAAVISEKVNKSLSIFDVVVNLETVKEMSKVIKLVKTARKLYPLHEEIRKTAMPCPECNLLTVYTPPQHLGDVLKVACEACGFEVPPDKIAFYAHLAEKAI
jgi:hypothetical protein